jgi:hypothetical protein
MTAASEEMRRAKAVSRLLAQRLANEPMVTLVDVGHVPGSDVVAVRVHIRRDVTSELPTVPDEIDGVPIVLLTGDYRLES